MVDLALRMLGSLAAALLVVTAAHAQQAPVPPHPNASNEVRKAIGDALEKGDRATVTRETYHLATLGASLSEATFSRIAPSLDPAILSSLPKVKFYEMTPATAIETLHRMFRDNATGRGEAERWPLASVPAEYRLVEGIAFDRTRMRLFAGTVIDGRLAYADIDWAQDHGKVARNWREVPLGNPRGGLFGMAIDEDRNLLWIATGSVEQTAVEGERMAGLIAVDLTTLAVVRRAPLPAGAIGLAGDVAVAPDGTVYASNPVSGAIHRCRPGCAVLDNLVPPGFFPNPQGMALLHGGKQLFVADYITGLWMVDRKSGKAHPVRVAEPTMLDGIDGLMAMGDDGLIAIQNGTRPHRIVQLFADHGRFAVQQWLVFAPDAPEATLGTVIGDNNVMFVANGQWDRYGPGGIVTDGKPLQPTPLDNAFIPDIVVTSSPH